MNAFKLAGLAACALGIQAAQAATLDFEGFAAGTIIDDEYAGITISAISTGAAPDVAVIFDSENPTGGDLDLGAAFTSSNPEFTGDYRPGNILILQENNPCTATSCSVPDDNARGGMFSFEFDTPVNITSLDFFDIEANEAGAPITAYSLVIIAQAADASPIGTWYVPGTGGDNTWDRLFLDATNVSRLDVALKGSGAIDNLVYSVVPVPAAAWLFGSGLAMLAGLRRRLQATA